MNEVEIISGYVPGAIGKITELHARYYHRQRNFGLYFETKVASGLCDFLNRYDHSRDTFRIARVGGEIVGSVAIDGIKADTDGAHLRWFIVSPEYQGTGIGKTLIGNALEFCQAREYGRVYLWTFAGLDAARHLYEKSGFVLCQEFEGNQWGVTVREQKFELVMK